MKENFPLVSVLMTAYNREKYIAEAIESVLASTFTNFELIIVDDGSKDITLEIAKSYEEKDNRIKVYINEVNLGDYPNRNKAASYAKGKYFTYVDSDDLIYPDTLSIMVKAANQYADAALFMAVRSIDEDLEDFQYLTPSQSYYLNFKVNGFFETGPLGVLIKKEYFDQIGGFSGKRMIGDAELWLRLACHFPVVRMQKNMVFWRQHEDQEFQKGFKFYLVDGLKMYKELLINTKSPIDIKEAKRIYKDRKLKHYKMLVKHFLKSWKIREHYELLILLRAVN